MPKRATNAKGRASRKASSGATPARNNRRKKPRARPPGKTKKLKTVGGEEFRFVTAKLYGEDAEKADWVAGHANLTDIVTSSVRLVHATLQKFFNKTLPDYYATPKVKLRHIDEIHQLMVDVPTDAYQQYIEADRSIEQRFGKSPGPEFLMSLAIQRDNPSEIAEEYLAALVQHFTDISLFNNKE